MHSIILMWHYSVQQQCGRPTASIAAPAELTGRGADTGALLPYESGMGRACENDELSAIARCSNESLAACTRYKHGVTPGDLQLGKVGSAISSFKYKYFSGVQLSNNIAQETRKHGR
jgi:hypothetical protein